MVEVLVRVPLCVQRGLVEQVDVDEGVAVRYLTCGATKHAEPDNKAFAWLEASLLLAVVGD